jgi:hypothetical protein
VDKVPYCQDHDFLEFPREVWRRLPPGVVNEDGQNFQEILVSLKERYEAEYLETLSVASP